MYTFSLILAVFLIGLGIGSSLGAGLSRRIASPRMALGVCQWLLTAAIAWTALMMSESLPYWPIVPAISASPWYTFQIDMVRASGRCCRRRACGGRASRWRWRRLRRGAGPGAAGGRRLCGEYDRGDRWCAPFQPAGCSGDRHGGGRAMLIGIAAVAALAACLPLLRSTGDGVRERVRLRRR